MLTLRWSVACLLLVCVTEARVSGYHSYHHRPVYASSSSSSYRQEEADSTLILTHVIFRHGNRTGQLSEIYPRDPYYNLTYFPFGRGQLTNAGKVREFNVGQALRTRYNRFLGEYFYPEIVDAVSTDYNRTKASLELALAGLFQPRGENVWNPALNWQPVPYNYFPANSDPVLVGLNCPNYDRKYNQLISSAKYQAEFNRQKDVFDYISRNTGLNITTYRDVYNLYFGLSTEEEWGHRLPEWTKSVWPKIITDIAIKNYYVETGTTDLLKLCEGYHLKKIIEDTKRKVANLLEEPSRKMYLYSAHENNIAEMLILLNVFKPPHVPTYGSYLMFEVHRINGVVGIKLYYQHYVSDSVELLKIPACDEFCPLSKFEKLFEEYLPTSTAFCYQT